MQKVPYASVPRSLMYAQICTHPDIVFIVTVLARYLSILGIDHWKEAKQVMRYLQRTKDYMLTYKRLEVLEIILIGCSDVNLCWMPRHFATHFRLYLQVS